MSTAKAGRGGKKQKAGVPAPGGILCAVALLADQSLQMSLSHFLCLSCRCREGAGYERAVGKGR